ncbi:MAG: hypothetical protein J2P22_05235 [Nocardioides sp.]|nr:hypothetical protein [Nocardioides sp.]
MRKTGTSSIQFFLRDNREALASRGLLYPTTPGRARHHKLSLSVKTLDELERSPEWLRARSSHPAKFRKQLRRRLMTEIEDSGLPRVLFSDEDLFGSSYPALRRLGRWLWGFAQSVRVVVYLRRQDDHLISCYQQEVKLGAVERLEDWALHDMSGLYDYRARLGRIRRLLAPAELVVRRYEQECFAEGSLIQDFLDVVGVDVRARELTSVADRNMSLDAETVEFVRLLNVHRVETEMATPGLIDNRSLVASLTEASTGPVLALPDGALDEFMARWTRSNELVARNLLDDPGGQLFHERRKSVNTTIEQGLDPARVDHFCAVADLPEELHAPLRRLAEREAKRH